MLIQWPDENIYEKNIPTQIEFSLYWIKIYSNLYWEGETLDKIYSPDSDKKQVFV